MIVPSLLLILIAGALLVLGLGNGSSPILIGSIVASLLAAIALVSGARRAAARRHAATASPDQYDAELGAPRGAGYLAAVPLAEPVGATAGPARSARAGAAGSAGLGSGRGGAAGYGQGGAAGYGQGGAAGYGQGGAAGYGQGGAAGSGGPGSRDGAAAGTAPTWSRRGARARTGAARWFGRRARRRPRSPEPSFADNPPAPDEGLASPTDAKARVANRDDAEAALAADAAYREATESSDAIDGEASQQAPNHAHAGGYPDAGLRARDDAPADAPSPADGGPGVDRPEPSDRGGDEGSRRDDGTPHPEESSFSYGAGLAEEFAEPDVDDPADEPLPQAVRPADAARVARMDAEVLVVDERPRYHLTGCPYVAGRRTEPLSVAEAVQLGFSPCGLCRPVDRLITQTARG